MSLARLEAPGSLGLQRLGIARQIVPLAATAVGGPAAGAAASGLVNSLAPALVPTAGSLQPGSDPAPVPDWTGLQGGSATNFGCNQITNTAARIACQIAAAALGGAVSAGNTPAANGGFAGCPDGYKPNPFGGGGCVPAGLGGSLGQFLPGDVGAQDVAWQPVAGLYGVGVAPLLVQRNARTCPPGYKLGKDDVCYDCLADKKRKHPRGTRPLLTGGQMRAINTARRALKRLRSARADRLLAPVARKRGK
jgi:hypothetical protein